MNMHKFILATKTDVRNCHLLTFIELLLLDFYRMMLRFCGISHHSESICLSVCLSITCQYFICPSVRYTPVLYQNG